jgi:hypothetical protein
MTLAVVWSSNAGIHLASDSRISRDEKCSDYGVKVAPVHIKVFEPSESDKEPSVVFDYIYGMCFAGDFAGAAIIRNFLSITLQRLQYIPTVSEVSFSNICRLINKFYTEISTKLQEEINNEGIDFFLSGYCPKKQKIMLAKFYIDYGDDIDKYIPKYEIINYESAELPVYYIGSGEDKYFLHLNIHNDKPLTKRPLFALKSLIESKQVQSVGGKLEAGTFDRNNDFYMLGIVEEIKNDSDLNESIGYYYSGINMNSELFELDEGGFIVMGNYIDLSR